MNFYLKDSLGMEFTACSGNWCQRER